MVPVYEPLINENLSECENLGKYIEFVDIKTEMHAWQTFIHARCHISIFCALRCTLSLSPVSRAAMSIKPFGENYETQ